MFFNGSQAGFLSIPFSNLTRIVGVWSFTLLSQSRNAHWYCTGKLLGQLRGGEGGGGMGENGG